MGARCTPTQPTCMAYLRHGLCGRIFCRFHQGHAGRHKAFVKFGELCWETRP